MAQGSSWLIALLLAGAHLRFTEAHKCSHGQHVSCTKVQSTQSTAPSTSGAGKGAKGSPLCTPEGVKVYCLVDHGYHTCPGDGEVPCCQDGAKPMHRGYDQGDIDDDTTCTAATSEIIATTPQTQSSKSEVASPASEVAQSSQPPIVLDDMDVVSGFESQNAHEGSFQACMKDSYKGQFHHDWARNKGQAHFTFKFQPPADGCYKIEEYHPGSDPSCARYMPRNAKLDVDYCRGKQTTWYINQAERPAQWNEIGSLPFYKGLEGKLTMRNSPDEECTDSSCFWVADAFRLTWTGRQCAQSTPAPREGVVTLRAHSSDGLSPDELQQELVANRGILEVTLKAYLGYSSVEVRAIVTADRRLGDATAGTSSSFKANFVAGGMSTDRGGGNLMQQLQAAFDVAGARATFEAAEVEWSMQPTPTTSSNNKSTKSDNYSCVTTYVMMGLAGTGIVLSLLCGVWMLRKRCQTRSCNVVKVAEAKTATDLEVAPVKTSMEDEKADANWDVQSVSTGTPPSEEGCRSDGTNEAGSRPCSPTDETSKVETAKEKEETV